MIPVKDILLYLYRVSQKRGTLDYFRYFDIRKYNTLSSEKNDTKINEIGSVVLMQWSFLKT